MTLCATASEKGISALCDRKAEAQPPGARNQPVKAVLRLGDIAAMDQRLENAIDAGLGNLCLLEDIFQSETCEWFSSSSSMTSSALERIGIRYSRLIFALGNRLSPCAAFR